MPSEDSDLLSVDPGDMTEQPPEPPGGIPKQHLPGWIRWGIRLTFAPFVILDTLMRRVATWIIRPPLKKIGYCHRRGNCCFYIRMRQYKGLLGFIQRFWATEINGFYERTPEPLEMNGHLYHLMGCRYLKKDGSCAHYRTRPGICRDWPRIEYFGHPVILKGCGYKAVHRSDPLNIIQ